VEPAPEEETEAGWTERLLARFGMTADVPAAADAAMPDRQGEAGWSQRLFASMGLSADGVSRMPSAEEAESLPSLISVISSSLNIMQVRIARSRLAGEPADVLISPRVGQLGLMDYHRADEAIAEGVAAVGRVRPLLRDLLGSDEEVRSGSRQPVPGRSPQPGKMGGKEGD
jgi:NTE family protein